MSNQFIQAQKCLRVVQEGHAFYCCDGQTFRSIDELCQGLKQMDEATFLYHAQKERNDFVAWVDEVIGDEMLAKKLEELSQDLQNSLTEVIERIKYWDRVIDEVAEKIALEDKFFFFES